MACCLFSSNLVLHPKLNYCQLYTEEQNWSLNQNTKVCFISKYCTTVLHDCFPCMQMENIFQMETFSALLAICGGNSPVPGEFPTQKQVTRSFDVFFDLRLNKRLSKQSWGWWFKMPLRPLWRHSNENSTAQPLLASHRCLSTQGCELGSKPIYNAFYY